MNKKERQSMGVETAKEYYGKQHPLRCALIGHKTSAVLVDGFWEECFRCGGRWVIGRRNSNPGIFEWVMRPLRIMESLSISRYRRRRWAKRFFSPIKDFNTSPARQSAVDRYNPRKVMPEGHANEEDDGEGLPEESEPEDCPAPQDVMRARTESLE